MLIAGALIALVDGGIIRKEFPIPREGISMDITFKTNSAVYTPISSMNINVFKGKVIVTQNDKIQGPELPMIEDRIIIESGPCPIGEIKRFNICFPKDEDDSDPEYSEEAEKNEVE